MKAVKLFEEFIAEKEGDRYVKMLETFEYELVPTEIVYSTLTGDKIKMTINQ